MRRIDPKESGKKLKDLRGIRPRAAVAREIGIPYSTLTMYERGDRIPRFATMEAIAEYYHVAVKDIWAFEEGNPSDAQNG